MFKKLLICLFFCLPTLSFAEPLQDALSNEHRSVKERLRDEYRNPAQTLRFFGTQPDMAVAEIWPGGGWYTRILAPYLQDSGRYYAAHFYIDEDAPGFFRNSRERFEEQVKTLPIYKNVVITNFHPTKALAVAPENSLDQVLTFRNVHNWYMRDGDQGMNNAFKAFFSALKKGGILGVVEHRLPESASDETQKKSGYMKQSYVIEVAKAAGFELQASSEINANPLDSADHPRGVWTLPPRLALGEKSLEKYRSIGESDRMTLKFIKP